MLYLKFEQHSDLREQLFETGTAKLVYSNPDDQFWGDGPDGNGDNQLGEAIMRVRELLQAPRITRHVRLEEFPSPMTRRTSVDDAQSVITEPGPMPLNDPRVAGYSDSSDSGGDSDRYIHRWREEATSVLQKRNSRSP